MEITQGDGGTSTRRKGEIRDPGALEGSLGKRNSHRLKGYDQLRERRMKRTTHLGMTQRELDLGNLLARSGCLSIAVQAYLRNAGTVRKDFYVFHCGPSTLRSDAERLEHGLFAGPSSSKRRSWVRLRLAVRDLVTGKVAFDKRLVVRWDSGDQFCKSKSVMAQ